MRKPKVTVACVANSYTGPNERIIEFSDPAVRSPDSSVTGGLISLRRTDDGRLTVSVYACTGPIDLVVEKHLPVYRNGKALA